MRKAVPLVAALVALLPVAGRAQSLGTALINLEVGQLLVTGTIPVPDGALVELLGDTTSSFGAPTASSFTGTDANEQVLDSFSLESSSAGGEPGSFIEPVTLTIQTSPTQPFQGEYLLLRWYPSLTISSSTPGSGTDYGQFSTLSVVSPSTIDWQVPAQGTNNTLSFLTTTLGGGNSTSAAESSFTVGGAVPEPASLSLIGAGLAIAGFAARRRK